MNEIFKTNELNATHQSDQPSPWVSRWLHLLKPNSRALDLACGWGRHTKLLAAQGHHVTAVDKDAAALAPLKNHAHLVHADLEQGPWPLKGQQFDTIVVTHYLWRDRWTDLMDCLAPQGVFIYETFAQGQETVGRPARPEFLLAHGELLQRCRHLRIVAYQEGFLDEPARFIQRIVAVREPAHPQTPTRYALTSRGSSLS